jgi:hypothetical protein
MIIYTGSGTNLVMEGSKKWSRKERTVKMRVFSS